MKTRIVVLIVFLSALLAPVLYGVWLSFSPDSFLTPPKNEWSLRWYRAFLSDQRWQLALGHSLIVAGTAGVLSVLVVTPLVYGRAGRGFWSQKLGQWLVVLPALLPPAVLGMGILPVLHWLNLWGTLWSVVLLHACLGMPIAFLILRTQCSTEHFRRIQVAQGLGASPLQIWWRVTWPLQRPVMFAAFLIVAVLSLNEALVTIFLATPSTETLPTVIWPQLRYSPTPMIAVASTTTAIIGIIGSIALLYFILPKFKR